MANKDSQFLKKRRSGSGHLIYMAIGLLIALITVIAGFRGKTQHVREAFGTTSGNVLSIESGEEIRADFTISQKDFQGIYIKFYSKESEFGSERLHFSLKDRETLETISAYTLAMRSVIPQADIFIPLPYADSAEKKVSLVITGQNIHNAPSVYLSYDKDANSTLFIGNQRKRYSYLVFSAAYLEKKAVDFQIMIKGALFFFLWILVGVSPSVFAKAQSGADTGAESAPAFGLQIRKYFRKHMKPLLLVCMVLLYTAVVIFIYQNNIRETLEKAESKEVVRQEKDSDESWIEMSSDEDMIVESFTGQEKNLSAVSFDISAEKSNRKAEIRVSVLDGNNNIVLLSEPIKVSSLPSSRTTMKLYLEKEYKSAKNQKFHLRFEPVNFTDSNVRVYTGSAAVPVRAAVGEVKTGRLPILTAYYSDYGFISGLYRGFCALVFLFLAMCFYMIVLKKWNARRLYVPVCLFLGILYMLIIPVYSVPDEYAHIDTAYSLSNRMMGIDEPEDLPGFDYRRVADIETEEYFTYNADLDDYRRLSRELFRHVESDELDVCTVRSTASNAGILYYVPSAIGITLGRIFSLSTIPTYLLGRLFSLLTYTLITFIALVRLEGIEESFLIYAALPIGLQQAASFSYDSMLNAFSLLFIAYCAFYATKGEMDNPIDILLFLFSALQMATVKGGVYIPLCLILLLIPLQRRWKWTSNASFYIMIAGFICAGFLQGNIVSLLNRLLPKTGTRINVFSGSEVYTLSYFLENPLKLFSLYWNTAVIEGSRMIYEFFGGKMGSVFNIQMPWIFVLGFIMILMAAIKKEKGNIPFRFVCRILCLFTCIVSVLFVCLAMVFAHTAVTEQYITGLQGRYYIPAILVGILAFLCRPSKKEGKEGGRISGVMLGYVLLHAAFLFQIIMVILPIITS